MKYKKRTAAGILAVLAVLCLSVLAGMHTVAADAGGYDRSQMLWPGGPAAPLQRAGDNNTDDEPGSLTPTPTPTPTPDPKAWKKIDGVIHNGSGLPIPGAIKYGIDVSEWQGSINWARVADAGVDFAFIRICAGTGYLDKQYQANMTGANAVGIPAGCYVYSHALDKEEAIKEAQLAIRMMQGYRISYPVVFDMEDSKQASLSAATLTDIALAFTREIKNAGYYPMVYLNPYWYTYKLDMSRLSGLDLWLAWYGDSLMPPFAAYRYSIWQGTGGDTSQGLISTKKLIDGIPVNNAIDVDIGFVDYTLRITPRTAKDPSYVPTPTNRNGWVEEDGKTYYYKNNKKVYGVLNLNGKRYRFSSSDGHLLRKTFLFYNSMQKAAYVGADGAFVKNTWLTRKGKRYYFGNDYYSVKGAQTINGKGYYFDTKECYMCTDVLRLGADGFVYYYGQDGVMATKGFTQVVRDGVTSTYYFNKQGKSYKAWHTIKGKRYYFYSGRNKNTGIRVENKTLVINGYRCVFDENGVCISKTKNNS